jgi:uncharacterized protein YkwD
LVNLTAVFVCLLVVIVGVVAVSFVGTSAISNGVSFVESEVGIRTPSSSQIGSSWVFQFMNDTNQYRSTSPLTYDPSLDNFSEIRFQSMVANYQISHYGFDQDVASYFGQVSHQIAVGEVVYFPVGTSPEQYLQEIQSDSPGHWQTMMDTSYHNFGYYIGQGPAYEVDKNCPTVEVPGPNINESQYFAAQGCTFTIVNTTWLVIDFTS